MKHSQPQQKKQFVQKDTAEKLEKNQAAVEGPISSGFEDSDGDSDDNEQALERLMAALGEDGLDEIAQNMLETLHEDGDKSVDDSVNLAVESEEEQDDEDEEYVPKVKLRAALGSDDDDDDEDEEEDEESDEERERTEVVKASKSSISKHIASTSQRHDQDEELIPLDEVSDVDEDVIPQQKLTVNNRHALESILANIQLDKSLPWTETLATTYPETHDVDVSNDLDRELSFYKQALYCAEAAKKLAAEHALPFTRPSDFFAEMVKSDAHMERTRQRLLNETTQIKRFEEKRREREGKKFGKQVQVEKLKERERSKKEMNEKIQTLKRKRKNGPLEGEDDDFNVALEEAVGDRPKKKPKMPRVKRDEKYGFGGKGSVGWRSKQNTRDSTDQFVSGKTGKKGKKGGKHVPKRPGKARRMASRQK